MDDLKKKIATKMNSKTFEDHKAPVSRRDLLRLGLIAATGAVLPLSTMQRAMAQMVGRSTIPFLVVDLAGGASMPGNFLVGQKGGPQDLFSDYRQHGWDPRASNSLDMTFGIPMSRQSSKILQGLKETLPAVIGKNEHQTMFKMASFCHFSLDDTSTNRSSAITMIGRSGLQGSIVRAAIGSVPSRSGSNSDVYLDDARFKPKAISTPADLIALASFGPDFESMSARQRQAIFRNLMSSAGGDPKLRALYAQLAQGGVADPRLDAGLSPLVATAYRDPQGSPGVALQAAIAFNVIQGQTGPGAISIANCDYHGSSPATSDAKDLEIGQAIGRAVHLAYLAKKPLFLQIITDGGVYASGYDRAWQGDSNQHSLSVLGYFDPRRPVQLRRQQVGNYTSGGVVDQETVVGPSPDRMVLATLANYLNLHGQLGQFENASGTRLQSNELDDLMVFA